MVHLWIAYFTAILVSCVFTFRSYSPRRRTLDVRPVVSPPFQPSRTVASSPATCPDIGSCIYPRTRRTLHGMRNRLSGCAISQLGPCTLLGSSLLPRRIRLEKCPAIMRNFEHLHAYKLFKPALKTYLLGFAMPNIKRATLNFKILTLLCTQMIFFN